VVSHVSQNAFSSASATRQASSHITLANIEGEAEADVAVRWREVRPGGRETGSFSGELCVGLATYIGSHSGRRWKLSFTAARPPRPGRSKRRSIVATMTADRADAAAAHRRLRGRAVSKSLINAPRCAAPDPRATRAPGVRRFRNVQLAGFRPGGI